MANGERAGLLQSSRAQLPERSLRLFDQKIDHVTGARLAQRAKAPQERFAGESGGGAERTGAHDVGAAAHPGIHQHGRAPADLRDDRRQHVDRRRQGFDLTAAMVRDDKTVDAEPDRPFGILRMQDTLDDKGPFPTIAIFGDFVPGERAGHFATCERNDVVERRVGAGIGLQIGETRNAVRPERPQPTRRSQRLHRHAGADADGAVEAHRGLARTRRAHRHVERQHQRMTAGGCGAAHQIEADGMVIIGEPVELKPEHVRRDGPDLFDGGAAWRAERVGNAGALRRAREMPVGARPHDRRAAHRRDADRRGVAATEQLHRARRQRRHHAVAGHDLDRIERRPIAPYAGVVGARTTVHVFEGEIRNVPARAAAQIGDGRETPFEARIVRTGAATRGRRVLRLRHRRRVMHVRVPPAAGL